MSVITSYNPMPISFSHGQGAWLYDNAGNKYLDGLTGIAVCGLGHNHPEITQAIQDQAAKLLHTSNAYQIKQQQKLGEKLTKLSSMEQVFFANSGAEANEAAIKIARLYGHQKGIDEPTIVVMEKAFHGRTMATLSASGNRKIQAGFEPLVSGFARAPFNDVEAIEKIAQNNPNIVAIMLEPIQGEGGINPPDASYLQSLRDICDKNDWLLILDEIQTGVGRTGKLYAYMHHNIVPDVLTSAKGLGNGMPIGACLMAGRATNLLLPGKHGSTFGGNPLACRVGLSVLETIEKENILENVELVSKHLKAKLTQDLASIGAVKEIRGKGLMLGIELDRPCREIMRIGLEERVLFNVTAEKVIRLLPPLNLSLDEAELLSARIKTCIERFTQQ